ncbi:uncharacterized protein LOC126212808 isoform X2 [Schistocerca nitens]|uniref:uncharacterized protein LOC126212808 isoform X2 n=1 Tax=Schistocerca nitens TaxID=7011 RepID=UPI002118FA08|nr:uncharacterized protein LOC126212808 isoform X2 [Schistocerca nitens]
MAMQSWADSVLKYPKDVTEVSRLLREPPADASVPATKRRRATPALSAPQRPQPDSCCRCAAHSCPTHTPPPEDAAVSVLELVCREERQ